MDTSEADPKVDSATKLHAILEAWRALATKNKNNLTGQQVWLRTLGLTDDEWPQFYSLYLRVLQLPTYVRRALDHLSVVDSDALKYGMALDRIEPFLLSSVHPKTPAQQFISPSAKGTVSFDLDAQFLILDLCGAYLYRTRGYQVQVSPEEIAEITELIDDASHQVADSDLPYVLKYYIIGLLNDVLTALNLYSLLGIDAVRESLGTAYSRLEFAVSPPGTDDEERRSWKDNAAIKQVRVAVVAALTLFSVTADVLTLTEYVLPVSQYRELAPAHAEYPAWTPPELGPAEDSDEDLNDNAAGVNLTDKNSDITFDDDDAATPPEDSSLEEPPDLPDSPQ